jgi:type VI secretion system Hcp family effector
MRTPFNEFIDVASETMTAPITDMELLSPFSDNFNSDQFFVDMEEELSGKELENAVELNEKYKKLYKWESHLLMILPQIGADPLQYPMILMDPKRFAIAFAKWQENNGYKGANKGVLGLNNWTYLQKKIGYHSLSNRHGINVEKAVAANKVYEGKVWSGQRDNIYSWLAAEKIILMALPLNDEYFAYAIADFQALKGLKPDGIPGPATFDVLKRVIIPPPAAPVTLTPSKWHRIIPDAVQSPAETFVNGNDSFKKIAEAIKTAKQKGHFIYLLSGWVVDIDFCLSPNASKDKEAFDTSSTLRRLLTDAAAAGVEIKILSWNNPNTLGQLGRAEKFINELRASGKDAMMFRDNFTYGTQFMKGLMSVIQDKMSKLDHILHPIDSWKELYAKAKAFPNEGSHHEKIMIINGSDGLLAFCGGMDINSDRVIGLKGLCCNDWLPSRDCDLEFVKDEKKWRSKILHDVHCKLRGRAAETLLQRFIDRWNLHLSQSVPSIPKMVDHDFRATDPMPAGTPYVKVLHTFNDPTNESIKDRSIINTVDLVIKNAERSILIEDQYMISPEIASWLNKAVHNNKNLHVDIHTHDDGLAGELLFPHKMRNRFRDFLIKGLNQEERSRIKIWMLNPLSDPPNRRKVHSKAYIIDDELAIIGSANCNRRSMTFDSETAVALFQDGSQTQPSVVKTLSDNLKKDRYNNWIEYKENTSIDAADVDVKIQMSPYYNVAATLMAPAAGLAGIFLLRQSLNIISGLLQDVIDPHPAGEPVITKEVETEFDEINKTVMTQQLLEYGSDFNEYAAFQKSEAPDYEIEPEKEDNLNESVYHGEDEHGYPEAPCGCGNKANTLLKNEEEMTEYIDQQVAAITKACDTLNCWAKTVLNRELGTSLPDTNIIDDNVRKALTAFQVKNNLPQTGKIDFATERALLEADALQRTKGTGQAATVIATITDAKTKIEDWTRRAVNTKPEFILNTYRDPRKLYAFVLHQMAFKRKNSKSGQLSDPNSYLSTGAHFCIMLDGRIIQLHPLSRMIWHGNCVSPRSVAVEFEGNFPNVKGKWWVDSKSKYQNKDNPTQAQFDSGRFLAKYLKLVLGITHILAHRQSSDARENDPGPDIWFNVGQWSIDFLGLSDGGPGFKCGTGKPILPEWRSWGNKVNPSDTFETSEETVWETGEMNEEETKPYARISPGLATIYLTLNGQKQGQIKGSVTQKGKEGSIVVYQLHHEITAPHGSASGMVTGKRLHKPLVITKEIDMASVKLLNAMVTNETIKQVIINFWQASGGGQEINFYRITLTNAAIVNISQDFPDTLNSVQNKFSFLERVELIYQKIEWRYLVNSPVIASDDVQQLNESVSYEGAEEKEWEDRANELDHTETAEESGPEHEDFFFEDGPLTKDWSNTIRLNRYYADKLGWNQYHEKVNDLLLPYSGRHNVSLSEEDIAAAVSAWQIAQGFSQKDADGIIGPGTWARMKPFILSTVGSTTIAPAPIPSTAPASAAGLPSQSSLGKLTVNTSIPALAKSHPEYSFTPDDALWLAHFVEGEAGGRDNSDSHAVIWAMFNRFGILRHRVPSWTSLAVFLRKYSTTLQPLLNSPGAAQRVWDAYKSDPIRNAVKSTKETYPGTTIYKVQYERHIKLQNKPWNDFEPYVRNMIIKIMTGQIPNPGIGAATDFDSTYIFMKAARSKQGITSEPSHEEWREYTLQHALAKKMIWIGELTNLNQLKNAFYIKSYLKDVPADAVKVIWLHQPELSDQEIMGMENEEEEEAHAMEHQDLSYQLEDLVTDESNVELKHEIFDLSPKTPEFENYSLVQRLDMVRIWKDLLLYKVPDKIVDRLRVRNMHVQYAHNESWSNDLNIDFYSLRINRYPSLGGVVMDAQSLIKYIRVHINQLVDTSYCDFNPYSPGDTVLWNSDNPLGAVMKLDIKGPDNASVVVSWAGRKGWQFSTIYAPDTGKHPVSGHREFYIISAPSGGGDPFFAIKGLDMMSTGVAGLGLPIFGEWGFGQADALWKSMRSKIIKFINSNGGSAKEDMTYSERVEWRFVYRDYKHLLEETFGKGAGSAANSSFFDMQLEETERSF